MDTAADCRERALKALDRMPPFSPVLNLLLATMAREDVSFSQIADLIERDTVLAGNVLRLVNSALYSFQGTVSSVRHAVAILGLNKLRNVGLSLSISRMWSTVKLPAGWVSWRFNLHSVATGILVDLIAPHVKIEYREGAFVAGLLHDVGKLLVAIALPVEYLAIRRLLHQGELSELECEMEAIGTTHARLSGLALEKWNLPQPIRLAAAHHHAPGEAADGALHLSHVIQAADSLANGLGHSVLPREGDAGQPHAGGLAIEDHLPRVLEQFEGEFTALRALF